MTDATNTAPIKWAQRSDALYVTIALPGKFWRWESLVTSRAGPRPLHSRVFLFPLLPTDVKDETINLTDKELRFKGKSGDKDYEVNIEFFKPGKFLSSMQISLVVAASTPSLFPPPYAVNSKESKYNVLPRSVQMHIVKAEEEDAEFWPRLLKDKLLEKNQVQIDWDRYVDEDDEEEEGGFDMSNMEGA